MVYREGKNLFDKKRGIGPTGSISDLMVRRCCIVPVPNLMR